VQQVTSTDTIAEGSKCTVQAEGFSAAIIDRFFRPFLGGIFFDSGLGTSSRLTSFVMRMLATVSLTTPCFHWNSNSKNNLQSQPPPCSGSDTVPLQAYAIHCMDSQEVSLTPHTVMQGANCLPEGGIGALTQQLASRLPAGAIRLGKDRGRQDLGLLHRVLHAI
jgi:hypothetical protein